jgi:glycopeptide antibiotics resistance protein
VIISLTTMPWSDLKGHSHWHKIRWIPFYDQPLSLFDIGANVFLFVPFSFFCLRSQVKRGGLRVITAIALAAALSASVELLQSFTHTRIPSTTDFCANVAGGFLGAAIAIMTNRVNKSSDN